MLVILDQQPALAHPDEEWGFAIVVGFGVRLRGRPKKRGNNWDWVPLWNMGPYFSRDYDVYFDNITDAYQALRQFLRERYEWEQECLKNAQVCRPAMAGVEVE